MNIKTRIKRMLIALDQALWCWLTLGYGSPDETISAAAWRLEMRRHWFGKTFRPVIDWLASPWEKEHCAKAYEAEFIRSQIAEEYRGIS